MAHNCLKYSVSILILDAGVDRFVPKLRAPGAITPQKAISRLLKFIGVADGWRLDYLLELHPSQAILVVF